MILNALALKLKRQARDDFRGRHFEATLIVQAVSWYLRYALSYRDIEEMLLERGLTVDHSTINSTFDPMWSLAHPPDGLSSVGLPGLTQVPELRQLGRDLPKRPPPPLRSRPSEPPSLSDNGRTRLGMGLSALDLHAGRPLTVSCRL